MRDRGDVLGTLHPHASATGKATMHTSALGHGLAIGEIPEEVVLPDTMTAAVIDAPGDASALHLATVPTPPPSTPSSP